MQSTTFDKASRAEQDLYWANVWFGKMAQLHGKVATTDWNFAEGEMIAFLRSKRDADVHAWKRVKILRKGKAKTATLRLGGFARSNFSIPMNSS